MRVGGAAEWLLEPATPDELSEALGAARELGLKVRLLGGGANLIVDDGVLSGAVIATGRLDRIFRPDSAQAVEAFEDEVPKSRVAPDTLGENPRLVAWAGATLPGLVRTASELGWSGVEGLVGVPGQVGGAITMNAGGRWGEIWDVVELVRVLTPEGELKDLERKDCSPTYRKGGLGDNIVVAVVLKLRPESKAAVSTRAREFLLEKNAVQPVTESCSGCIFKNPDPELSDGRSAGRLIDELGLKGLSRGQALVSPKHANFIVNKGGARATDVLGLIDEVQDRVREQSGIQLGLEVQRWRADQ